MKLSDFKRLARISINERKTTTKSTVKGITFGLVLLIPLLFITMSFYVDLNRTVNADTTIRNFEIGIIDEKTDKAYSNNLYSGFIEKIEKEKGVNSLIKLQSYLLNNTMILEDGLISSCMSFNLNGKEYPTVTSNDQNMQYSNIGFEIFKNLNPSLKYEKEVLLDGEFFSGKKGEIMLSTSFLDRYNLSSKEVVGKLISIDTLLGEKSNITTSQTEIKDELIEEEGTKVSLLKDYRIIGVFNSNIYNNSIRSNSFNSNADISFWLNDGSLDKTNFFPKKIYFEKKGIGNYIFKVPYFYYEDEPSLLSNNAIKNGNVFLPIGFGVDVNRDIDANLIVEMKDYQSADNLANTIDKYLVLSSTSKDAYTESTYMNETFKNYRLFYKSFTYICTIFAIFGGVVFFTNLLNLYNTINYSVASRTNYIGLTRAIGMKSKDVIIQYFIEIMEIFKRSYLLSALIGGGISLIIKYIFDYLMSNDISSAVSIKFTLNPLYIFLSFGIIVLTNTIIAYLFAYISSSKVANMPILDTLIDDK